MIELTGEIYELKRDYETGKAIISVKVEEEPRGIETLRGKPLRMTLKQKRGMRSLDSNAYFHVLVDKLSKKIGISFTRMKHLLIFGGGELYKIDGQIQEVHSNFTVDYVMEHEFDMGEISLHFNPIGVDGDGLNIFRLYRGSKTYDSKEMARLIDWTIQQCKDQDIETATPDQLAEYAALWEMRRK